MTKSVACLTQCRGLFSLFNSTGSLIHPYPHKIFCCVGYLRLQHDLYRIIFFSLPTAFDESDKNIYLLKIFRYVEANCQQLVLNCCMQVVCSHFSFMLL